MDGRKDERTEYNNYKRWNKDLKDEKININ